MAADFLSDVIVLIPARLGSSRFPNKPLVSILGLPMIGHVLLRSQASGAGVVAVATCDIEIREFVESIGGRAVMTGDHHERASDRCAEALLRVEAEDGRTYSHVVMVQGDEPMLHPEMIAEALAPLQADDSVLVTNLLGRIDTDVEFRDPSCIKVVCNTVGDALFMTRQPVPTGGPIADPCNGKQVCIMGFRREALIRYAALAPTPLEEAESVDMLRFMEHGIPIRMAATDHRTHAVDTPDDVFIVEAALSGDPLTDQLLKR